MNDMKTLISLINESFNSDRIIEPYDSFISDMIKTSLMMAGHSKPTIMKDQDDNVFSASEKDGAIEIHHHNMQAMPGTFVGESPNFRFVGSAMKISNSFLKDGHPVRFVSTDTMTKSLKKIVDRMNHDGKYSVEEHDTPDPEMYGAPSHIKLKSIKIQKVK